MEQAQKKVSLRQRWDEARATKRVVFGFAMAAVVLTLIVGFNWGGWVTGSTAHAMANDAVVQRLAGVCVAQFDLDSGNQQKLGELQGKSSYQRDDYVKEQGWATMPGQEKPDNKVADACAKRLMQTVQ